MVFDGASPRQKHLQGEAGASPRADQSGRSPLRSARATQCETLFRIDALELALLSQRLHRRGQTPEVDEARGLGLVVVALAEGDEVLAVKRVGRGGARGDDVALVELQLHRAGDVFVALIGEGDQRLGQRRVPLAVVVLGGKVDGQLLLFVQRVLVDGLHLKLRVGEIEDRAAGVS